MTAGENGPRGETDPILLILEFTGKEGYKSIEESLSDHVRGNRYNASSGEPKIRVDVEYKVIEDQAPGKCPDCLKPGLGSQPSDLDGDEIPMRKITWPMVIAPGFVVFLVNVFGGTCTECKETICSSKSTNFAYEVYYRALSAAGLTFAEKVIAQRKNPGDIPPSRREGPYF